MSDISKLVIQLEKMANRIDQEWKNANYSHDVFPSICEKALKELAPFEPPTLLELNQYILNNPIATQYWNFANFSDFPFTLVFNERFFIDLYYWFYSDTTIHNHHFCGAFKVVQGLSLQFSYEFNPIQQIDDAYWHGELKNKSKTYLDVNHVQKIDLEDAFIHKVFHSHFPTLTLCIRTPQLEGSSLWNFLAPSYKILYKDFSPLQRKWYNSMKTILMYQKELAPTQLEEIPFNAGNILQMIIQTNKGNSPLDPLQTLLLESIQKQGIAKDFMTHLEEDFKTNNKIRSFEKIFK